MCSISSSVNISSSSSLIDKSLISSMGSLSPSIAFFSCSFFPSSSLFLISSLFFLNSCVSVSSNSLFFSSIMLSRCLIASAEKISSLNTCSSKSVFFSMLTLTHIHFTPHLFVATLFQQRLIQTDCLIFHSYGLYNCLLSGFYENSVFATKITRPAIYGREQKSNQTMTNEICEQLDELLLQQLSLYDQVQKLNEELQRHMRSVLI